MTEDAPVDPGVQALVDEQVAYYRARAPQYDDWWERREEYDLGDAHREAWQEDVESLRSWLAAAGPLGDVLELAAGTGNWTRELAARATRVTAVDASPETLAINAAKVAGAGAPVEHVAADLFDWEPPRRFDTVFFSFWLSHVPVALRERFWSTVDDALAPGGRVLLIDNARAEDRFAGPDGVEARTLRDGSAFTIVKRYWTPAELEAELAALGWRAAASETRHFVRAEATR